MLAFMIWSMVALLFIGIGWYCWNAKKVVGFFTFNKPIQVAKENEKSYNHAVAKLWFGVAIVMELLGVPFLFFKQNSPIFLLVILGMMPLVIIMICIYLKIEDRYEVK